MKKILISLIILTLLGCSIESGYYKMSEIKPGDVFYEVTDTNSDPYDNTNAPILERKIIDVDKSFYQYYEYSYDENLYKPVMPLSIKLRSSSILSKERFKRKEKLNKVFHDYENFRYFVGKCYYKRGPKGCSVRAENERVCINKKISVKKGIDNIFLVDYYIYMDRGHQKKKYDAGYMLFQNYLCEEK